MSRTSFERQELDHGNYLNDQELVKNANGSGKTITQEQVRQVVTSLEQRIFSLSDDRTRIRVSRETR